VSPKSDRGTPAVDALAAVRDILAGDDDGRASSTFVRGLTLGALIGAAVAGSAIWGRRARRGHPDQGGAPTPARETKDDRA
jgi:hypothetical protein